MKTITLWQPWASLLACGAKKYETRGRATSYRGPIAIHAAKKPYNLGDIEFNLAGGLMSAAESALGIYEANNLPLGAIVATAELVGCWKISACTSTYGPSYGYVSIGANGGLIISPNSDEFIFGDWTPGRYALEFKNMVMLPEPIPAKGAQGLWSWEGME